MEEVIIDTNGWIQIIEGTKKEENKKLFEEYVKSKKYKLIFSEMVAIEFLSILSKPEKIKTLKKNPFFYFRSLFELIKIKELNITFLPNTKYKKDPWTYFRLAKIIFNKYKIDGYCFKNNLDFHKDDLAIFLSLRDCGYDSIKFFSGDKPLKEALEDKHIKNCLKKEKINIELISFERE